MPPLTDVEMRAEGAKFRDFWHAKSGRDATKVDWKATWRNWCRTARGGGGQMGFTPPAATPEPREPRMEDITV